jgi:hypothetical protein
LRRLAGMALFQQAKVAKHGLKENFKGWLLRGNID